MSRTDHHHRRRGAAATAALALFGALSGITIAPLAGPTVVAAATGDCHTGTGAGIFFEGDGSSGSPLIVTNSAQLAAIDTADCTDEHYLQTADITLTGTWAPIGATTPFSGTYDGGTKSISGLQLAGATLQGLFAEISGATISDLVLSGPALTVTSSAGSLVGRMTNSTVSGITVQGPAIGATGNDVGGLVGIVVSGRITDVNVIIPAINGADRIGGVIGSLAAGAAVTITDTTVSGPAISADSEVGGVLGSAHTTSTATITDVTVTGPVMTVAGQFVGGLAGTAYAATISGASVTGPVVNSNGFGGGLVGVLANQSIVTDSAVTGGSLGPSSAVGVNGGLIGQALSSTVSASHSSADALSNGIAGGLVGTATATWIEASYATGDTTGTTVGGLVASASGTRIVESYATGDATSNGTSSNHHAGGLLGVGDQNGNDRTFIERSYATGAATGGDAGGLVGELRAADMNDSYARGPVNAGSAGGALVGRIVDGNIVYTYGTGAVNATGGSPSLGSLVGTFGALGSIDSSLGLDTDDLVGTSTGSIILSTTVSAATLRTWDIYLSPRNFDLTPSTYGWNPANTWSICPEFNDGYAFLSWQVTTDPCTESSSTTPGNQTAPPPPPMSTTVTEPESDAEGPVDDTVPAAPDTGDTGSTTPSVIQPAPGTAVLPATGDGSAPALALAVFLAALGALSLTVARRRHGAAPELGR